MIITKTQSTKALIYDLEVFPNLTMFVGKVKATGEQLTYISHDNKVIQGDLESIRAAVNESVVVGYNNHGYDDRLLSGILKGASNDAVYRASTHAISQRSRPVPLNSGQCQGSVDLAHLLKTGKRYPSLKAVASVKHYPVVGDLPLDPKAKVDLKDVQTLLGYCQHDVEITDQILDELRPQHTLRRVLECEFGVVDALNKSDPRIGEEVLINRYCELAGTTESDLRDQGYENVPLVEYDYKAPAALKDAAQSNVVVSNLIRNREHHEYKVAPKVVDARGVVTDTHKHLNRATAELFVGGRYATIKQGGLHTVDVTTDNIAHVRPGKGERLIELDVASMYPTIILESRIAPRHFDQDKFLDAYRGLVESRLDAKAKGDDAKADGLKISINAVYGKLSSPFSALYDPKAQTSVTNTGQIALSLLMEWMHEAGHKVVTANTDAVTVLATGDVSDIVKRWEGATGLTLEETQFDWLLMSNVSDRAMKITDGPMKYKGAWSLAPSLTKKLNAAVVPKAIVVQVLTGESVEDYINRETDIREFLTSVNTNKNETKFVGQETLQKNSRLYHSTDGYPIRSISKKDNRPTESDDKFSTLPIISEVDNLDRSVYIADAQAKVDSIVDWVGTHTDAARDLSQRGLVPMPLQSNGYNFKGQSGRLNSRKPKTEDYSIAGALGAYTGVNANNILCLDVDDPTTLPREVRRHIAESDGLFCWSTNEGKDALTVEEVKSALIEGKPGGKSKVLYVSQYKSNLPGKVRFKSHSGTYGKRRLFAGALEIFYGEKVNVLGTSLRKNQRRFYSISEGKPCALPGALVEIVSEQFEPRSIKERVEHVIERDAGKLNTAAQELLVKFLKARGMNVCGESPDGIKGHCPIHNHSRPSKDEYMVGCRDDGSLWHKCFKDDAGPAIELNAAWVAYQESVRKPVDSAHHEYLSTLRPEERTVRERILSDENNLILTAPPRTGKTGGVVAAIITKPRDGSLLLYVAKDKKDMVDAEDRLIDAGYYLDGVNAQLLNAHNPLTKAHDSADVIITHWTYLNSMGDSGEQYALLRLLRDRAADNNLYVAIDEFDAFVKKLCRRTVEFDGRRLKNSGKGQYDKYTDKCPQHARSGNCTVCQFVEGALFADSTNPYTSGNVSSLINWDNRGGLGYSESLRVPVSVFSELELGAERQGEVYPTQFSQKILQDTPGAPDVDNVGQSNESLFHEPADVFHNLVGSLDGAALVTTRPVLKETRDPVNPSEIGEGKRYSPDEIYFPAASCGVRRISGVYLGGLRALSEMGAKIRLLSATFPPEVLENVETALGKCKLEKIGSTQKQIAKTFVIATPNKINPLANVNIGDKDNKDYVERYGIGRNFSEYGGLIFANQNKDIDTRKRSFSTALKTSKLYQNNAVQVIGGDGFATDNFKRTGKYPEQVNFTFLSTKGGYSRAVNWEHPKVAMLTLIPTYPGIMYSESETEDELLARRIADTEVDAIQSAFRIMSIQKGEVDPLRVIVIHSIDPLFLDESGKPNIDFIERELNMVSLTNEVFYVNNEESIQNALDWAGEFLRTGILPEGRNLMTNETTALFDKLINELEKSGQTWAWVYSHTQVKRSLQRLGWDAQTITNFHARMKTVYDLGGVEAAVGKLREQYEEKDIAA
jgi:hypothetical protein